MLVLPAIDLMDGQVVRLEKGDFGRRTTYSGAPAAVAEAFRAAGAARIHVVDLDGARAGKPVNRDAIRAIAAVGVPFEVGGGLRTLADVETVLALGAAFAVLGTAAVQRLDLVREACARFPGRIVCGIDARGGSRPWACRWWSTPTWRATACSPGWTRRARPGSRGRRAWTWSPRAASRRWTTCAPAATPAWRALG